MTRRAVEDLERVDHGEVIIRLVGPRDFDATRVMGERVLKSAPQARDITPNENSYGASVFVVSRLGELDLRSVLNKPTHLEARVSVMELEGLGIEVRLSPEDCEVDLLRAAHASLIGVTPKNRSTLMKLVDAVLGERT